MFIFEKNILKISDDQKRIHEQKRQTKEKMWPCSWHKQVNFAIFAIAKAFAHTSFCVAFSVFLFKNLTTCT